MDTTAIIQIENMKRENKNQSLERDERVKRIAVERIKFRITSNNKMSAEKKLCLGATHNIASHRE